MISTENTDSDTVVKKSWFGGPRRPRKKITLKSTAIYLFNLYLCFLACGLFIVFGIRDRIALFPMQDTKWKPYLAQMARTFHVQTEEMTIAGPGGHKLAALLIRKPGSRYVYLISHGNAGNLGFRIPLATYIIGTGQSVFMYDYEGYGESQGEAKLNNLIPDATSAYDYLTGNLGYKENQIILYGESIGTGPTTALMQIRKPAAVVLQSGFTSLITAGKDKLWQLKIFPDFICPEPHLDNLSAVEAKHPPLLFIHGDQDIVLPVNYSRTMFAAASQPKTYFEARGAGHNDICDRPENLRGFSDALKKLVAALPNQNGKCGKQRK